MKNKPSIDEQLKNLLLPVTYATEELLVAIKTIFEADGWTPREDLYMSKHELREQARINKDGSVRQPLSYGLAARKNINPRGTHD